MFCAMRAIRGMSISSLDRRVLQVTSDGLGNVDGEVADALEVGVDLDGGDDRAQVHRHRLMQRQELEAAVVNLDVQLVDGRVARAPFHQRHVAL